MIQQNREGHDEFDIDADWYRDRNKGVSAMLRVGNEEEWIGPCLESIVGFFDEIVITINCDDRTLDIIETFDSPKIEVYEYPFEINPNGPVHDEYPADSVHDRAYYYNWSLSKTTYTHVSKWDADMLMLPEYCTEEFKRTVLSNRITFTSGWEVVTDDFSHVSKTNEKTGNEIRFFEVKPWLYYRQGSVCENFVYPAIRDWRKAPLVTTYRAWNLVTDTEHHTSEPTYLHTKHIKQSDKQAWPDNWEEIDHFQDIDDRKQKGRELPVEPPEFCFNSPEAYLSSGR